MIGRLTLRGIIGMAALLGVYFSVVSLISGAAFAWEQFSKFWYFIVSLALGFGIQVSLYSYLKSTIYRGAPKRVVAVTGTTSTLAMISCCSHYLANILPLLGIAGVISLIGQYQIELFWVGLFFNVFGIVYIGRKAVVVRKHVT